MDWDGLACSGSRVVAKWRLELPANYASIFPALWNRKTAVL